VSKTSRSPLTSIQNMPNICIKNAITCLNFCQTFKHNKKDVTPAMHKGIAKRP